MAEKTRAWSIPQILGTAVVTIVLWSAIGFSWSGSGFNWKTQGEAKRLASTAVTEQLTSICVAQAGVAPESAANVDKLKKMQSWERSKFVLAAGWATMPGNSDGRQSVAEACAMQLVGG